MANAATIWADGPGGNPTRPNKAQIREWGSGLEADIAALANADVATIAGTTYSLSSANNRQILNVTNSSSVTITAPSGIDAGFLCLINQRGAGRVTVVAGSGATIAAFDGGVKTAGQYAAVLVVAAADDTFQVFGGVSS